MNRYEKAAATRRRNYVAAQYFQHIQAAWFYNWKMQQALKRRMAS